MNNIVLFVCGLAVTMISGMGVLVYMVHLGYNRQEKIIKEKKIKEIEAKIDADLGAIAAKKRESFIEPPLSVVEIPSVS